MGDSGGDLALEIAQEPPHLQLELWWKATPPVHPDLKSGAITQTMRRKLLRRSDLMHGSVSEPWTTPALNFTVASTCRWLGKACQETSGFIVARVHRLFPGGALPSISSLATEEKLGTQSVPYANRAKEFSEAYARSQELSPSSFRFG